jgi:hypothetical protein
MKKSRSILSRPQFIVVALLIVGLFASNGYLIYQNMLLKQYVPGGTDTKATDPETLQITKPHEATNFYFQPKRDSKRAFIVKQVGIHDDILLEVHGSIPLIENGPTSATMIGDNQVIYADGDGNLKSYDLKTLKNTTLLNRTLDEEKGNFSGYGFSDVLASPDGKRLLVSVYYLEGSGVGILNSDGSGFTLLSKLQGPSPQSFDWSHDSKQFVVSMTNSEFGGEDAQLYLAQSEQPENGKNLLPLNPGKEFPDKYKDALDPRFSPDDTRLAFSYKYMDRGYSGEDVLTEGPHLSEIYMVNTDGTNFRKVTSHGQFTVGPLWMDNTTLIYSLSKYYTGRTQGLYTINLSNSAITKVSDIEAGKLIAITPAKKSILALKYGPSTTVSENANRGVALYYIDGSKDNYDLIDFGNGSACFTDSCINYGSDAATGADQNIFKR